MRFISLLIASTVFSTSVLANEVNVYSAREEQLIKPLLNAFSKDTGIKVNLVTSDDDPLLERLKREGTNSKADVLIMADAGRLARAVQYGVLQPIQSPRLQQVIPAYLRDPAKRWFGLTSRARVIFYAKGRVNPNEIKSYEDLTAAKWKGRICVRSSNSIYNQSLVASMIAHQGEAQASQWVKGLVQNFARPPSGGDRDQIKGLAAGECDIALGNTYYYAQMLFGGDSSQKAAATKAGLIWPNQSTTGTHINISGAGITTSAPNKANAIKLLEYMTLDDAQRWYSTVNGEYPVTNKALTSAQLQSWGNFKADTLNLGELGKYNQTAVKLMDQAGWR
ncbi:MAG: Fe(3+) ABC transporter substrate-binding protein [Thiofilum sp.]|uniref:Fe(3+) ABC transporter substrate-binding protein n=1 Tax=Thiofilum sp. TaxID=2212733 RepID=UPI0025DF2D85|nr:Fe(3+) ABC transporter substrate-binding protein [Thiofilum sp.]MBK8454940.1 Fe(3+) ABC transporter substrate-binding protein [Thiofilum sp.]